MSLKLTPVCYQSLFGPLIGLECLFNQSSNRGGAEVEFEGAGGRSPPYRVSMLKYPLFARIRPFLAISGKNFGASLPNNFAELRFWGGGGPAQGDGLN